MDRISTEKICYTMLKKKRNLLLQKTSVNRQNSHFEENLNSKEL